MVIAFPPCSRSQTNVSQPKGRSQKLANPLAKCARSVPSAEVEPDGTVLYRQRYVGPSRNLCGSIFRSIGSLFVFSWLRFRYRPNEVVFVADETGSMTDSRKPPAFRGLSATDWTVRDGMPNRTSMPFDSWLAVFRLCFEFTTLRATCCTTF